MLYMTYYIGISHCSSISREFYYVVQGKCDIASMSIIMCFVLSKFVIGLVLMWSVESDVVS